MIRIEVGDRVTYNVYGKIKNKILIDNSDIEYLEIGIENKSIEILKIECPKYEVVEESISDKELLTEEEREFLKNIIKWYNDVATISFNSMCLYIEDVNEHIICSIDYPENLRFIGIEDMEKEYTLQELGLEE